MKSQIEKELDAATALAFVTVAVEHLHNVDQTLGEIPDMPQTVSGVTTARAQVKTAREILEIILERAGKKGVRKGTSEG